MTATIIDFATVLNARRAAESEREAQRVRVAARDKAQADLVDRLGGSIAARIVAEVVTDVQERQKDTAREDRPLPAYCDPANEVRGSKYEATRNLDIAEIAKRMRADIKALGLAAGIKTSVRTRRYSGGQAIDITITALPEGFAILCDATASWYKQFPGREHEAPGYMDNQRSEELRTLIRQLERIHGSYNRDNSDSMTDYFDVRFYGSVGLDWEVRRDRTAEQVATNPGTYWAEDC
jgi:hypothetical protein